MSIEHVCRITSSNYNSIISVPSAVPSSAGSSSSSSSPLFQTVSNNANGTTSIEVHPASSSISSSSSSSSSYTAAESLRKQLLGVDYSLSADSKTKSEMAKLLRLLSDSLESDMGGEGAALRATEETTRELLHVDVETMEVEMAKNIVSSGGEDMHSVSVTVIFNNKTFNLKCFQETASTAHSSAVHSSESQPNSDSPALHYASSSSVEQHQHHQTGVQLAEEEPSAVVRMEEDGPTTNGDIGFDSRKTTETENNNFERFPFDSSNYLMRKMSDILVLLPFCFLLKDPTTTKWQLLWSNSFQSRQRIVAVKRSSRTHHFPITRILFECSKSGSQNTTVILQCFHRIFSLYNSTLFKIPFE